MVNIEGRPKTLFLDSANASVIKYFDTANDTSASDLPRAKVKSIFFYRPSSFEKAYSLYQSGEITQAQLSFAECKDEFKSLMALPQNYGTRAAFYEMECARRKGDLEGLESLLKSFKPEALVNENYIAQLEIYSFWTALLKEEWDKILEYSQKWKEKEIAGYQRAQILFCEGKAYAAKGNADEALNSYAAALVFSQYKETSLIINAANESIKLLLAQDGVAEAKDLIGSRKQNKGSKAYRYLKEASALAKFWNAQPKKTKVFPSKYKFLLDEEL